MALIGQLGSYNQTVGIKVDMDEAVDILPVDEVPLQNWVPMGPPAASTKIEWLNEELTGQEVTVTATSATASTTVVLDTDDGDLIRVGDVLVKKNDDGTNTVQVRVDSISTDTLTVVRPFADSTDEALNPGDVLAVIGQYRNEGSDPEDGRAVDRTSDHNFTQIFQEKVEASRTTRLVSRYGMGDPYDHEVEKKFRELNIRFERALIHGRRKESTDKKQRSAGGYFFYVTSNTESGAKANIETEVNELLEKCWNNGGKPETLFVSPAIKRVFATLNNSRIRYNDGGATANGGVRGEVVDRYVSDFGDITLVMDRYLPKNKAILVQRGYSAVRALSPWFHELLSKTGDAQKGHIVCEKALEVRNEKAQGVLTVTDA